MGSAVRKFFSNLSSLWGNDGGAVGITDLCCEVDKSRTMLRTAGALRTLCDIDWGLMFLEFCCSPELFSMTVGRPVLSDIVRPKTTNIQFQFHTVLLMTQCTRINWLMDFAFPGGKATKGWDWPCIPSSTEVLTLILLTWRICWAPHNGSRWQMGLNLAFKELRKNGAIHLLPYTHSWHV